MDITISNQARMNIRDGLWLGPTPGLAPGFIQANLVVLPSKYAFDLRDIIDLWTKDMQQG